MNVLERFSQITGWQPVYLYSTFAFILAIILSLLLWLSITSAWHRRSAGEMTESEVFMLIGRVFLLFFFFLLILT